MVQRADDQNDVVWWLDVTGDENCSHDFARSSPLDMVTDSMRMAYHPDHIDVEGLIRYLKSLAVKLHEVARNVDHMADNADLSAMIRALESEGHL